MGFDNEIAVSTRACPPITEPSAQLLIVDLGECCAIKVEKGTKDALSAYGAIYWQSKVSALAALPFKDLQAVIDAAFAVTLPLPRIERRHNQHSPWLYTMINAHLVDCYVTPAELATINALAKQAGATQDLPVYCPTVSAGTWKHLNRAYTRDRDGVDIPVGIWRFEVSRPNEKPHDHSNCLCRCGHLHVDPWHCPVCDCEKDQPVCLNVLGK